MSLKYLLDTNIISEVNRIKPNANVTKKTSEHEREIGTASVVNHELLYGCLSMPESKKRQLLLAYVHLIPQKMPILNYSLEAAQWHEHERARLTKLGRTPAFVDGQIAYSNNLILVTNNVSDFQFFENLRIENWFIA
jgi:tRNA(fMet)-specific endonuclease VapC